MPNLYLDSIEINGMIFPCSSDGWRRISNWMPDDPERFSLFVSLKIGLLGELGAELFHVMVFSRRYYVEMSSSDTRNIRRRWKYFVVESYDWNDIWSKLKRRIETSDRGNWPESLRALRMSFTWEFESMDKPSPPEMH